MKKSSLLLLLFCTLLVTAQEKKPVVKPKTAKAADSLTVYPYGSVTGTIYSDAEYIVIEPQAAPNTNKSTSGRNSFGVRRAQLGYEQHFSRTVTAVIAFDIWYGPQEAKLEVEGLLPMHTVTIGMMRTLAERTAERFYGYRSLGEMVLERNRLSQEYDRGIQLLGKLAPDGSLYYAAEVTNGSGWLPEGNKLKHLALAFGIMPDKGSVAELYMDYENTGFGTSTVTGKFLYAVKTTDMSFGFDGFYRMNRKFNGGKDVVPAGASFFSVVSLDRSLKAVVRLETVDQDLNNAGNTTASYREVHLDLGLDYLPAADVHLIPNIAYGKYLKKGSSTEIKDALSVRLTAAVSFK